MDGWQSRAAEAVEYCLRPARLHRTVSIALVVGTILTIANQADVLLAGTATMATGLKIATNFVTPFVVSNLGLLSGRGRPA